MKKILIFALVAMIAGMAFGMGDPPPTPEQQRAIAEMKANEELQRRPTCDDPIIVTIAGIPLSLPRIGLEITPSDGVPLSYLDHRCEIKKLEGVHNARYPHWGISDARFSPDYQSTFERLGGYIQEGRKTGSHIVLPNGLDRIQRGFWFIYVAPKETLVSFDNKPIAFDCPLHSKDAAGTSLTDNCTTTYLYKENLLLGYSFFRKQYPDEDYIRADQDQRKWIEDRITDGE